MGRGTIEDALVEGETVLWRGKGTWHASFPRFSVEMAASTTILLMGITGFFGYLRPSPQGWNEQAALLYRVFGDAVSFLLTTWGAWGVMTAVRDLVIHANGEYAVTDSRILIATRGRPGRLTSLSVRDVAQVATVPRGVEIRNAGGRVVHSLFGIEDAIGAHKAMARADRPAPAA